MGFLNQIASLFKLPQAQKQATQSQAQASAVAQRLGAAPVAPPLTRPPVSTPVAPVKPVLAGQPPQNAQIAAQIAAIQSQIPGLTQSVNSRTNAPPAPSFAPAPALPVPTPSSPTPQPNPLLTISPLPTPAKQPEEPSKLDEVEKALLESLTPSTEETDLKTKLSNLLASRDLGLLKAEEEAIPLQAIAGEQEKIERRAGIEAGTLTQRLARVQEQRQAAIDVGKTRFDFEKERFGRDKKEEDKVGEYTNAQNQKVIVFKDKKTGTIRQETVGTEAGKEATQTDRDRAIKAEVYKRALPILNSARGTDGYVNPQTYLKLRSDYAEAVGDASGFDAVFAPMLSPAERTRLGVGRSAQSGDVGSLLSAYLGAQ